ncbi:MAG: peptidoglycan-associated lipoprotein Pal [Alphaproteobacteria bacterium]|nr:peptidoglycan-associated lipoprotein Pal [Alphaproteobacteria bacterium]
MSLKTIVSLFSAVLMLAACETASQGSGSATGGGQQTASADGGRGGGRVSGDRVFFEFDRSDLQPQARKTIESWANWMRSNPSTAVTIEGHADERGTREYNLALGERRAQSAKNYLVALGVSPNRVRTLSYGKERPAVGGHDEQSWAQNRRSVLTRK